MGAQHAVRASLYTEPAPSTLTGCDNSASRTERPSCGLGTGNAASRLFPLRLRAIGGLCDRISVPPRPSHSSLAASVDGTSSCRPRLSVRRHAFVCGLVRAQCGALMHLQHARRASTSPRCGYELGTGMDILTGPPTPRHRRRIFTRNTAACRQRRNEYVRASAPLRGATLPRVSTSVTPSRLCAHFV